MRIEPPEPEWNVLALVKPDGQRFVFIFDDEHRGDVVRTFGRFAARSDLSFTWYDAAVLSQRVCRARVLELLAQQKRGTRR